MSTHAIHHVHGIFINASGALPNPLPPALLRHEAQARHLYPEARYHMWSGEACRDIIKTHFEPDVLAAFDHLTPYAFKADLARYCLLHQMGGLYADLSLTLQNRWEIPVSYRVAAFTQGYETMDLWLNTMQSLLWSLPGQREWELAIRDIVAHCRDRFYGPHDHHVTGPALIGRCFARAMLERGTDEEADQQFMGEVRLDTEETGPKTSFFISPTRTLVATKAPKVSGSLRELGLTGGNHYPQLWRAKRIYGETASHWHLREPMFHAAPGTERTKDGLSIPAGHAGLACYGPYIDLPAGRHVLTITLTATSRLPARLVVEIAHGEQHRVHRRLRRYLLPRSRQQRISLAFTTGEPLAGVEFRLRVSRGFCGTVQTITLREG